MTRLIGETNYAHDAEEKIGILLVNLGTPDAPTPSAVRRYLKQFLSDARVIEAPRWLWWWVLRFAVLPFRPLLTAAAYQKIWTKDGSPLLGISRRQQAALRDALRATTDAPLEVALAMSYGNPSIAAAVDELAAANCRRLFVLPLYPQFASSTVGSVFTDVTNCLARRRLIPHFRFIAGYCDEPRYIAALAASIADFRARHGAAEILLFSFHGTPRAMLLDGDPYHCFCHKTARLTAEKLGLTAAQWRVTFQSRFGRAVWLQPYTDETLRALAGGGTTSAQVVCPAFSADCLETLEEIAGENRDIFLQAGGTRYEVIPALNDGEAHIQFLRDLTTDALGDWTAACIRNNATRARQKTLYEEMRRGETEINDTR